MNLIRCENGHFYDSERFDTCPHCEQTSVSTVYTSGSGEKEYTMALPKEENKLTQTITSLKDHTIGYFGAIGSEPVVGWLVAIAGNHFGEDFKLKTGRNFIGRSTEMDIALTGDTSVSRDRHAIILYEPKGNAYLVQPGDAKELFYINDQVVLSAREIAANDVLTLGETRLMFIPCCSDKFNWDSVKPDEKGKDA